MSISTDFNRTSADFPETRHRRKRPAPFSLRLTAEERERLLAEAGGAPLGAYIKAKLLGVPLPARYRRSGLSVEDRQSLGRVLALLGQSRLSANLNQLAHAAHLGALLVDEQSTEALNAALADVRAMRALLLTALGLKPGARP